MYFPHGLIPKIAFRFISLLTCVTEIKQKVPADQLSCVHCLLQIGKEQSSYIGYLKNICVL